MTKPALKLTPEARVERLFGEPIEIKYEDIIIPDHWDIPEPKQEEIPAVASIVGEFPVLLRKVDDEYLCVAPAKRIRCLQVAAKQGLVPQTTAAFVIDGCSEQDAEDLHQIVSVIAFPESSDEWRQKVCYWIVECGKFYSRPWFTMRGKEFLSAITGVPTASIWRWKLINDKAVPEVRALIDEGKLSIRTAQEFFIHLDPEEQRTLAAKVTKETDKSVIAKLVREQGYKRPMSTKTLIAETENYVKSAIKKDEIPSLEEINTLQYYVSKLFMAASQKH